MTVKEKAISSAIRLLTQAGILEWKRVPVESTAGCYARAALRAELCMSVMDDGNDDEGPWLNLYPTGKAGDLLAYPISKRDLAAVEKRIAVVK